MKILDRKILLAFSYIVFLACLIVFIILWSLGRVFLINGIMHRGKNKIQMPVFFDRSDPEKIISFTSDGKQNKIKKHNLINHTAYTSGISKHRYFMHSYPGTKNISMQNYEIDVNEQSITTYSNSGHVFMDVISEVNISPKELAMVEITKANKMCFSKNILLGTFSEFISDLCMFSYTNTMVKFVGTRTHLWLSTNRRTKVYKNTTNAKISGMLTTCTVRPESVCISGYLQNRKFVLRLLRHVLCIVYLPEEGKEEASISLDKEMQRQVEHFDFSSLSKVAKYKKKIGNAIIKYVARCNEIPLTLERLSNIGNSVFSVHNFFTSRVNEPNFTKPLKPTMEDIEPFLE